MKLPGRTPILVELPSNEYSALSKMSDSSKLSMTLIVRDLIREHLMKEELVASFPGLSKRLLLWSEEGARKGLEVHLSDEEHSFVTNYASSKSLSVTHVIRNLIRKHVMGVGELPISED